MGRRFIDMAWIQKRMNGRDARINRALREAAKKEAQFTRSIREAEAMTTDRLTLATTAGPTVTTEQLALVKSAIAPGAAPWELQLFLYDCARQGVHPLDKLIHFTKRSGKYTPITSIDFMRQRAADSGEYAGNDDPEFTGEAKSPAFAATARVYRIVQGQRYPFAATARWSEYKPDQHDFMWQKMPFVMLGKCAEALALRKGFPKQLHGLYVTEEMDQASARIDAPVVPRSEPVPTSGTTEAVAQPADLNAGLPEAWQAFVVEPTSDRVRGRVVAVESETKTGRKSGQPFTKTSITLDSGEVVTTLDKGYAALALECRDDGTTVDISVKSTRWGKDILSMARLPAEGDDAPF